MRTKQLILRLSEDELAAVKAAASFTHPTPTGGNVARFIREAAMDASRKFSDVVTYTAPSSRPGARKLNVCTACDARLTESGDWPRNDRGEEFCQVSKGLHHGICDTCEIRIAIDEENAAETFWDEIHRRSSAGDAIARRLSDIDMDETMSRHEAHALWSYCADVPGFEDGPTHAPTALLWID